MVDRRKRAVCPLKLVALAAAVLTLGHPQPGQAQIEGCPPDADSAGDKIVIGSVTELVGEVSTRLSRALLAAFEMQFEMARADLRDEVRIIHCENRPVRDSATYDEDVVENLNDKQLLLEVGAHPDGQDIKVTYVVIPIRYYTFVNQPGQSSGFHEALYKQSEIGADLEQLFKGNAELRLMAALALAVRHEKLADGEDNAARRQTLIDRSRAFYCEAVGSMEAARPRDGFLGLPQEEWEALDKFATSGARRMFEKAMADDDYVGSLSVVASERGGDTAVDAACILPPIVEGPM